MKQLHKKFTDFQIKDLMTRYLKKEVERKDLQKVLGIKKTRFFALIKRLKEDPKNFSVSYFRSMPTRTISKDIETNIIKELNTEKKAELTSLKRIAEINKELIPLQAELNRLQGEKNDFQNDRYSWNCYKSRL